MRPGIHPIDELAMALVAIRGHRADWRKLRRKMLGHPLRALYNLANDLRQHGGGRIADRDPRRSRRGVVRRRRSRRGQVLPRNTASPLSENLPFMVVMAIRSDFLGQLQSAAAMSVRFEEFSLGPMPTVRIPEIIRGPRGSSEFENGLVQQASQDAETEDALPLHCPLHCVRFGTRSPAKSLSLDGYKALGDATPLENAVRQAADRSLVEAKPTNDELMALREAFVPAMVRVNDEGQYVRRPARWDELRSCDACHSVVRSIVLPPIGGAATRRRRCDKAPAAWY